VHRLECGRRGDGRYEDLRTLVVGGDEDRDARAASRRAARGTLIDVPQAEREQAEPDGRVDLEHQHRQPDEPGVEVHGEQRTPNEISQGHRERGDRDGADQEEASRALGKRELAAATGSACHAAQDTMRRTIGP
jgi:hypothetical protein